MPSSSYDLVSDDGYDSRVPLHNEDAFQHGIIFKAKYIGSLEVPRPNSRVEIVAAMRRIRYEFKVKGLKKRKALIMVSVEGVKVMLKRRGKVSKNPAVIAEDAAKSGLMLFSHPIYRIFYVSHDSQDLKIFSYIAREGSSNVFKCNVFKSYKKSQAMRTVRTIGQAFEVCHQLSIRQNRLQDNANSEGTSIQDGDSQHSADHVVDGVVTSTVGRADLRLDLREVAQHDITDILGDQRSVVSTTITSPIITTNEITPDSSSHLGSSSGHSSVNHRMQLLEERFQDQEQQTQAAMAQVALLREQLAAEQAARIEAQERIQTILLHNKQLLHHITQLVGQMQELERRIDFATTHTNHGIGPLISSQVTSTPRVPDICSQGSGQILYAQLRAIEPEMREGGDGGNSSDMGSSLGESPVNSPESDTIEADKSDREMKYKSTTPGSGDSGHESSNMQPPPVTPEILPPYSRLDPNHNHQQLITSSQTQQKITCLRNSNSGQNLSSLKSRVTQQHEKFLRLDPPPPTNRPKRGISRPHSINDDDDKEADLLDLTSDEEMATSPSGGGRSLSLPTETPSSEESSSPSMENIVLDPIQTPTIMTSTTSATSTHSSTMRISQQ